MPSDDATEQMFPSTTFAWKYVKVRRPAGGQSTVRSSNYGFRRLRHLDRNRKVHVTFTWKGGTTARWLVEARGQHAIVDGFVCIEDLLAQILGER